MALIYLVAACLVAVPVLGRPQDAAQAPTGPASAQPAAAAHSDSTPIPILNQSDVQGGNGSFTFSYETGNGIRVQEEGHIKQVDVQARTSAGSEADANETGEVLVIQGQFSYTAPDGQNISLNYVADENGFQAHGEHLPTPPPIPEAIAKSLGEQPQSQQTSQAQPQPQPASARSLALEPQPEQVQSSPAASTTAVPAPAESAETQATTAAPV